jgi:hypothetical protein
MCSPLTLPRRLVAMADAFLTWICLLFDFYTWHAARKKQIASKRNIRRTTSKKGQEGRHKESVALHCLHTESYLFHGKEASSWKCTRIFFFRVSIHLPHVDVFRTTLRLALDTRSQEP